MSYKQIYDGSTIEDFMYQNIPADQKAKYVHISQWQEPTSEVESEDTVLTSTTTSLSSNEELVAGELPKNDATQIKNEEQLSESGGGETESAPVTPEVVKNKPAQKNGKTPN